MEKVKRAHAIVWGRVQGVYYRASTRDQALALQLTGWVRNLADGNVEFEAQGEADKVDSLLRWAEQGPPNARVSKLDYTWLDPVNSEASFDIIY